MKRAIVAAAVLFFSVGGCWTGRTNEVKIAARPEGCGTAKNYWTVHVKADFDSLPDTLHIAIPGGKRAPW